MEEGIAGNNSGNDSEDKPDNILNDNDNENEPDIQDDELDEDNLNKSNGSINESELKSDFLNDEEEEDQKNRFSLIEIASSIANSLLNEEKPDTDELENQNSLPEAKETNSEKDEEKNSEEEDNEEEEEEEKNNKESEKLNSDDEKNTDNDQNADSINASKDEDEQPSETDKKDESNNKEENKLQILSNSIVNQLVTNNNNNNTNEEYEYVEEEEEEEEEEDEKSAQKAPEKHLPPPHLLETHQIPNSELPKRAKNDSIEDLENEVMITGYATPKTDIDEEPSNDNNINNNSQKAQKDNKGKNKKNSKNNSTENQKNTNNSDLTEEEIEKGLNRFLKTKKLPDKSIIPDIITFARQKTLQLMMDEDYDKAIKMQIAAEQLSLSIKDDNRTINEKEATENIESRITEATQHQKDINYKYQDKIEEFEKLKKQSQEKLMEKHQNEIYHFYDEWDNEKKLLPFLKQSPQLLQLRQMQRTHAITKNFAEAKQLKKAADKLQKEETQIAKLNASNAMKSEYDALIKQQQIEVDLWTQNWDRKRQIIEMDKKQEEEANENLRNQLNNKLKSKKIPKRQTVMLPINSSPRGSLTLVAQTNVKSKMIEFKTKTTAARLDLRPAEVKAIVKPKLKSPRKFSSSFS